MGVRIEFRCPEITSLKKNIKLGQRCALVKRVWRSRNRRISFQPDQPVSEVQVLGDPDSKNKVKRSGKLSSVDLRLHVSTHKHTHTHKHTNSHTRERDRERGRGREIERELRETERH